MRTHLCALLAALLLLVCLGAGTAAAQAPAQASGQVSGSQQSASSSANAAQVAPSNRNVDVRIFSPGDGGAVTQTNAADATALAGNQNSTDQSASQGQAGSGTQTAVQQAGNDQSADATANAVQVKPSNSNISVRIDSPGDDGPVKQTNAAGAAALAGNHNDTTQSAEQEQGGGSSDCCKHGGGTQAVGQSAHNDQSAGAEANAVQLKPSNSNVSVRIGSPGDGGSVTQTNAALAGAQAKNGNDTSQTAGQSQDGSCKCGGGVQAVDQKAKSDQSAKAESNAKQIHPSNSNTSVRIHSPGDDGPVKQTNLAVAESLAGNANSTDQSATQSQGAGGGVQAAGQSSYNDQDADAESNAIQVKPSNKNTSVRIGSHGDGGSVSQTNAALAGALAGNSNETTQSAGQAGGGVQAVGQKSGSLQDADADGNAFQLAPSNGNYGGGGDVAQKNVAGSLGIAFNENSTDQSVEQSQDGGSCKCHGGGVQAVGQKAINAQYADAESNAVQLKPSNDNTSVGGKGGGDVRQTNAALSGALAGNTNDTTQTAAQEQDGSCKCYGGVQAAGQFAFNYQDADADANAVQLKPSNDSTSVGGKGGGDVRQTNAALSGALAGNANATTQSADQSGGGDQVAEQLADSVQFADADANAFQIAPSNGNTAVGFGGGKHKCGCRDAHEGGGGDVKQTNIAAALGIARNANSTDQVVDQTQRGDSCKCYGGGLQVAGQKAWNWQDADASVNALQFGASNRNLGGGSVRQANLALALGIAANWNRTGQEATQSQP